MRLGKTIFVPGPVKCLVVGIIVGVLFGSAGVVFSALGKEGWAQRDVQFKLGYIAGFNDVVRMAKRSMPQSTIAQSFAIPRDAKLINWLYEIEQLFKDPRYENRSIVDLMALAGGPMAKKFGGEAHVESGLERLREAMDKRREAMLKGEIQEPSPEEMARYLAKRVKADARQKCMRTCHRGCRKSCDAEIKEKFPTDKAKPPVAEKASEAVE